MKKTRTIRAPQRLNMVSFKDDIVSEDGTKSVKCPICHRHFSNKEALGGHTSKAHPNESSKYRSKMQRRNEREPEREILELAKLIFYKQFPGLEVNFNRSRIASLKTKIHKMLGDVDRFSKEFKDRLSEVRDELLEEC